MNEQLSCSYDGYMDAVQEMAASGEIVVVESRKAKEGKTQSPWRVEVGLAEQSMVLMASGLALEGKRVFVFAPFSPVFPARSYEQIRAAVALPKARVVLSSVQDGATLDRDGAVRQMNEDFAIMRVMPNMAVLAPSDRNSAAVIARSLLRYDGPAYVRLSHEKSRRIYEEKDGDFHVGGGRLLTEGDGVTICVCGIMVGEALVAAEIIDCYSIKPLPEQMLLASVRRTGCCVVAEKHTNAAGLYGAVTECLCRSYTVPVRSVAMEDKFGQSGTPEELREYYGLTHREIVHNVVQAWAMRRR